MLSDSPAESQKDTEARERRGAYIYLQMRTPAGPQAGKVSLVIARKG